MSTRKRKQRGDNKRKWKRRVENRREKKEEKIDSVKKELAF